MKEKVLLALSGGVDSTVAALLLAERGYDVSCAVFVMSDAHLAVAENAKDAAAALGLPIDVLDLRDEFREKIIVPFCESYCRGLTPSPCVICNPLVKFRALADLADAKGIDKIATGHYARIERCADGYAIGVSSCAERDQSYMLYRLPREILSRLMLPLEGLTKDEVRKTAADHSLSCASAPDSEENCFIPGNDYVSYMEALGYRGPAGSFLLPDGRKVPHGGIHRYTVGQRKGLGISYSAPLYVKSIDPSGDITLCLSGGEYGTSVRLEDTVLNPCVPVREGDIFSVKIRSAARPVPAEVVSVSGDGLNLLFPDGVRAACPGQSAVLYAENIVAGGGIISSVC